MPRSDDTTAPAPATAPAPVVGLAHVATVSFLASRASPTGAFAIALAGGVALARAAATHGVRAGYGASAAAILQTVALMGPARVNGPLTQALSAPLLGRLHARGAGPVPQFLAVLAIRLVHYALLTALFIWIVLGGVDAYAGSFDAIARRLGVEPPGTGRVLALTALFNTLWAIAFSVVQVAIYRRALDAWPDTAAGPPPDLEPAASASEPSERRRLDPRPLALAAAAATIALLATTAWPVLAAVAVALVAAWIATRADPRTIPFGAALAALLAFTAITGSLVAGLGADEALRRGLRAALLVGVATWLRAAAGPEGLRELFQLILHRLRRVPGAREAAAILGRLDPDAAHLRSAARHLLERLAGVHRRPWPIVDAVIGWVAGEADRHVSRAGSRPRAR
jgi:hypothetical protein